MFLTGRYYNNPANNAYSNQLGLFVCHSAAVTLSCRSFHLESVSYSKRSCWQRRFRFCLVEMQPCLLLPHMSQSPWIPSGASSFNTARGNLCHGRVQDAVLIAPDYSHSAAQPAPLPCDCAFTRSALPFLPFSSSRSVIFLFFFFVIFFAPRTCQPISCNPSFSSAPREERGVSSNRKLWKAASPLWHRVLSCSHCRRARQNERKKFLTF